jgi:hypothetical protein
MDYEYASVVINDAEKDQLLREAGYKVIRVPYFVQMREPVIGELFGGLVEDRTRRKRAIGGLSIHHRLERSSQYNRLLA